MKILIDADACPRSVFQFCIKIGRQYGIPIWTISNFNHDIKSDHHVTVGDDPQEADIKIVNLTEPGDIVVTGDWGLAAMVLSKGARCLSPTGTEFRSEKIGGLLEEREIRAKLRRAGSRLKGPKKRTLKDDQRFENCLEEIISKGDGGPDHQHEKS